MLRGLLMVAALAFPANAQAALNEIAPFPLVNDCGGATGAPGEVVGAEQDGVRFAQATANGFVAGARVELGDDPDCPLVISRPSGAGVLVTHRGGAIIAFTRDPGGQWAGPVTVAESEQDPLAAVSDRGDAIIAFKDGDRFVVSRRGPGGAFGPLEQIGRRSSRLGDIVPAISSTGEAFAVTTTLASTTLPARVPVAVSIAPPGGAFGAPQTIADTRRLSAPAIDVDAQGRALIAIAGTSSLFVSERAPGGAFGPVSAVGTPPAAATLLFPAVRLAPAGAAAVGWMSFEDVQVMTRGAGGTFTPVTSLLAFGPYRGFDPFYFSESFLGSLFGGLAGGATQETGESLTITPDGRAVFGTAAPDRHFDLVPTLVTLPLGSTTPTVYRAPSHFGNSGLGGPLVLADGSPAIVWTDPLASAGMVGSTAGSRLRMAAPSVLSRLDPPPFPEVTIGAPVKRRLGGEDPLRLPVRCSAACDVQAAVDSEDLLSTVTGATHLGKAGRTVLEIPGLGANTPARVTPVEVRIATGPPGALRFSVRTITVRIAGTGDFNHPTAVSARRRGDKLEVTVRVAHPDNYGGFFVSGDDTRGWNGEPAVTKQVMTRAHKRSYTVTLPAAGVKWVRARPGVPGGKYFPSVVTRAR